MLVVTVELWPGGNPTKAKEIAAIEIANISDLHDTSSYIARVQERGEIELGISPSYRVVEVHEHPRRQSVFKLLKAVLKKWDKDNE